MALPRSIEALSAGIGFAVERSLASLASDSLACRSRSAPSAIATAPNPHASFLSGPRLVHHANAHAAHPRTINISPSTPLVWNFQASPGTLDAFTDSIGNGIVEVNWKPPIWRTITSTE